MLSTAMKQAVKNATVRLPTSKGLGVVVGNGLILTTAHCLHIEFTGEMALGAEYPVHIASVCGTGIAAIRAVEPVSDIAVLGCLDSVVWEKEAQRYELICKKIAPLMVCQDDIRLPAKSRVHIWTHEDRWLTGKAYHIKDYSPTMMVETHGQIKSGTSGGPVVNDRGELVGIVSSAKDCGNEKCSGRLARPFFALPTWVCVRLMAEKLRITSEASREGDSGESIQKVASRIEPPEYDYHFTTINRQLYQHYSRKNTYSYC